jgi:N-acetylated-alpha-linked acidic dipeptidase
VSDATLAETRIGSGSDHTVFLNHLGIPTLGLTFDGPYGVYHSVYDSFYWMNRFGDPGYRYHTLMSGLWGVLALRLANADLLPHDFAFYARALDGFLDELVEGKDVSPLALGPLREAVARFEKVGARLNAAGSAVLTAGGPAGELGRRVNQGMLNVERNWLHPGGIPGRPWFKHLLYAARYTYAHLELPGLTEAVEAADWPRANEQARLLQSALGKNTALLEGLAADLKQAAGASEEPAGP